VGLKSNPYWDLYILAPPLAVMIITPLIIGSIYLQSLMILSYLFGVIVAIYDFFYIRSGYINLGYTYMVASAAFAVAIAMRIHSMSLSIPASLLISLAMCSAILIPMLRLRGPFYSVATLLYPFALAPITRLFPDIFGGDAGIYVRSIFSDFTSLYYSSIALGVLAFAVISILMSSRVGVILTMIRDDEILAESSGIRVDRIKILSHILVTIMITAIMFFYTQVVGAVSVELADPIPILIYALMATAIYKPGSSVYSFIAGIALWWLDGLLRAYLYDLRLIIISILLISIYILRRG
jgi:branched-chain amino acid transport system permease protein